MKPKNYHFLKETKTVGSVVEGLPGRPDALGRISRAWHQTAMLGHICNLRTQEPEAEGSRVQGQGSGNTCHAQHPEFYP